MQRERSLDTARGVTATLAAMEEVGGFWGAEWQRQGTGGELELPVQAGLRHGLLRVAVTTAALDGGGTRLQLRVVEQRWVLHRPAAGLLVVAGLGSLAAVTWPFLPALGGVVPLALVLAVGAWLGVLSRLRNRGLDELLAEVEERLEREPTAADEDAAASREP
jgi:hypothetical protein